MEIVKTFLVLETFAEPFTKPEIRKVYLTEKRDYVIDREGKLEILPYYDYVHMREAFDDMSTKNHE